MANNQQNMRGLMRGMNPDVTFTDQPTNDGPRGGVSEEQWQAAQQKMSEILARQPKLNNKSSEEVYADQMQPQELQQLNNDFEQGQQIPVLDDAKIRALQKMRGSGQPPQGF